MEKGKMVVCDAPPRVQPSRIAMASPSWVPPSAGWAKLNTDDNFVAAIGAAGGGMILRDDRGDIIFSACR